MFAVTSEWYLIYKKVPNSSNWMLKKKKLKTINVLFTQYMQNVWSLLLWKRNVMKTPSSGLLKLLMMYVHTYYIFKDVNISHHRHPDVIWSPDHYIQLIHELRACRKLAWRVYRWDTRITMHMCRMPSLNTIPVSQMYVDLIILMCLYKSVTEVLCY